ncbi:cytochrome P450 [Xylogone sp. PMI_703]|nr:cytochrome P450 [Xylogone sp. PMI_703]
MDGSSLSAALSDRLAAVLKQLPSSSIVVTLLGTLALCPLLTWLLSKVNSQPAPPGTGKEPPVASYWLPWFQHLFGFLRDPNGLFQSLEKRYPGIPFTIPMMDTKFHIFSSATTAATVFSKSREFIFPPVVASMMENGLNLPIPDRPFFNPPPSQKRLDDYSSHDFVDENHNLYLKYLTSRRLDDIISVYMDNFYDQLDNEIHVNQFSHNEWTEVKIHQALTKIVFETSVITFFGTRLQKLWGPSMWDDFRTWTDATYIGVRANWAYYFQPRAYIARKRMLQAFEKWVDCDAEEWNEEDGLWNEKWGCRMNWEREILARKVGFTHRGRACSQAGFLFVIMANSAPMATWFMHCLIESRTRLQKFREAIQPLLLPPISATQDPNDLRFDMAKLKAHPYIHGLWNEALRLGSASAAARVVANDTELEGYVVKGGSVVLLPVRLLHFNPDVFPEPEKFIPERWIPEELPRNATDTERVEAQQVMRKRNASLRSFGGGTGLCSGRFVAEMEMFSTVSTLLMLFDIEVVGEDRHHNDPDVVNLKLNPRSIGIMSPKGEPRVRMRKRKNPRSL